MWVKPEGNCRGAVQDARSALAVQGIKKYVSFEVLAMITPNSLRELKTEEDGASRRIRTSDRSVRSRVLYPAELWMHKSNSCTTQGANYSP